jgi:hypothetical protein
LLKDHVKPEIPLTQFANQHFSVQKYVMRPKCFQQSMQTPEKASWMLREKTPVVQPAAALQLCIFRMWVR